MTWLQAALKWAVEKKRLQHFKDDSALQAGRGLGWSLVGCLGCVRIGWRKKLSFRESMRLGLLCGQRRTKMRGLGPSCLIYIAGTILVVMRTGKNHERMAILKQLVQEKKEDRLLGKYHVVILDLIYIYI